MRLIKLAHPETTEILANARADRDNGEITDSQFNEIVKSCFQAEIEAEILGKYPENIDLEAAESYRYQMRNEDGLI